MRVKLQPSSDRSSLLTRSAVNLSRKVLEREDVCGSTLLVYCLDTFGYAVIGQDPDDEDFDPKNGGEPWDPYTIELEITATCGAQLKPNAIDRCMAAISILTSDDFFVSVDRFIPLANVLSGDDFDPSTFDVADPEECSWAVMEALMISPPDAKKNETVADMFSEEVKGYIGYMLKEYGYMTPPKWLSFAPIPGSDGRDGIADDPALANEFFMNQDSQLDVVDSTVKSRLISFAEQLTALKLTRGKASAFGDHLIRQAQSILLRLSK